MSQESIWEKSLSGEVSNSPNPSILIKRTFGYPLTDLHLRNYLNSHSVNDISLDSLYDYFRDNLFKDFNGLYLPHLLCMVDYMSYDKIYKALDEVFQAISPNTGSLTEMNYNYFQFFLLVMRKNQLFYLQNKIKELYELGLKHGLDVLYRDTDDNLMNFYYAAIAPFEDISVNYEYFLIPKRVDLASYYLNNVLWAMDYRFVHNVYDDRVTSARIEKHILYKEMLQYIGEGYVYNCFAPDKVKRGDETIFPWQYEVFNKAKTYIKSYIADKSAQK